MSHVTGKETLQCAVGTVSSLSFCHGTKIYFMPPYPLFSLKISREQIENCALCFWLLWTNSRTSTHVFIMCLLSLMTHLTGCCYSPYMLHTYLKLCFVTVLSNYEPVVSAPHAKYHITSTYDICWNLTRCSLFSVSRHRKWDLKMYINV